IAPAGQFFRAGIDGDPVLLAGVQGDARNHPAVVPLCEHVAEHMAHPAADPSDDKFCHDDTSFPLVPDYANARQERSRRAFADLHYCSRPLARRACSIFASWASPGSTRGRRHLPASQPSRFMAYLTGMGLTSQNMASHRGSISSWRRRASAVSPSNHALQQSCTRVGAMLDTTLMTPLPPRDSRGRTWSSLPE